MPRDDISTTEVRSNRIDAPSAASPQPTLISLLAREVQHCWRVSEEIDRRDFAIPAKGREADYQRMIWKHRLQEVWRRRGALQAAIAALPAETMADALIQLTIALATVDIVKDNTMDEAAAHADGIQAEFLIASARRLMLRETGLTLDDLGVESYLTFNGTDGTSLDELLTPVEPLNVRGAA